ncbi:unnamed protein product [Vicia faba]|uniref:Uncharacterized protein n=1 Tax=Vicia faba TaxID=3906 RepID=A0AAV1AM73_VICFA|nr:unnamed protein product [Vicia faba]
MITLLESPIIGPQLRRNRGPFFHVSGKSRRIKSRSKSTTSSPYSRSYETDAVSHVRTTLQRLDLRKPRPLLSTAKPSSSANPDRFCRLQTHHHITVVPAILCLPNMVEVNTIVVIQCFL